MTTSATMVPAGIEREIRIGLVLYGGVSLAIYEYGVTLEFLRLVRASRGVEHNAYTELLSAAKAKATVDIISGTSAGGINGVALAKALAQGEGMEGLRRAWVDKGDIAALMNKGTDWEAKALLDARVFEKLVLDALNEMDAGPRTERLVDVLDLFVTSTNLHGRLREAQDYLGRALLAREHQKVFHLRFRTRGYNPADPTLGYDRDDFGPDVNPLLTRVCRATSAFPAAFRPVELRRTQETALLFEPDDGDLVYYSDGGILDNKPFTTTIRTIFSRAASHKVNRVLFFVEPDPESFTTDKKANILEPNFLDVLSKSTLGIPRYEGISADLRSLQEHNQRVWQFQEYLAGVESIIAKDFFPRVQDQGEAEYRAFLEGQAQFHTYIRLRLERIMSRLLSFVEEALGDNAAAKAAFAAAIEVRAEKHETFLNAFDIPYRVRQSYRLIESLSWVYNSEALKGYREEFGRLELELWAEMDRVRDLEWRAWHADDESITFGTQLKALGALQGRELAQSVNQFLDGVAAYLNRELDQINQQGLGTARKIDALLTSAGFPPGTDGAPSFEDLFTHFEAVDMFLYPVAELANLGERDPVDVLRISPEDATFIKVSADDKLAGDTLFHFGGFVEAEWRRNDIMWGRLDAAELITRTVLKAAEMPESEAESHIRRVQEEIALEELERYGSRQGGFDYKAFLEDRTKYDVGTESPSAISLRRRASLGVRGIWVIRNMFHAVSRDRNSRLGIRLTARWARRLLTLLGILGLIFKLVAIAISPVFGRGKRRQPPR
jgi:predicted acylesterase/phospholipase RssA